MTAVAETPAAAGAGTQSAPSEAGLEQAGQWAHGATNCPTAT